MVRPNQECNEEKSCDTDEETNDFYTDGKLQKNWNGETKTTTGNETCMRERERGEK